MTCSHLVQVSFLTFLPGWDSLTQHLFILQLWKCWFISYLAGEIKSPHSLLFIACDIDDVWIHHKLLCAYCLALLQHPSSISFSSTNSAPSFISNCLYLLTPLLCNLLFYWVSVRGDESALVFVFTAGLARHVQCYNH